MSKNAAKPGSVIESFKVKEGHLVVGGMTLDRLTDRVGPTMPTTGRR